MATTTSTAALESSGKPSISVANESNDILKIVLPYAVAIFVQLPLFVLYIWWLLSRPHYSSWFPFAFLATGLLIWSRWPKDGKQLFMESIWSNVLLVIGLLAGIAGVLFVEPWCAALSVYTLIASLMARVIDRETGRSCWTSVLPLFVSLAIPKNYDQTLISWLQSSSAHLTSRLLDLVNIAHYMPGTVIQVPGNEYGIEEACSGIQSFFLLVFVAVVISVWLRRTFFRAVILLIAAIFWSIFMNCVRIFIIPVFDIQMGIDLSSGVQHSLLGWTTMAIGILLLLSTDQFLMFLFGPVDPGTGSSGPLGKFITKVWNGIVAGKKEDEETGTRRRSRRKPLSALSKSLVWGVAGILTLGGLFTLLDIKNCYKIPNQASVTFFSSDVVFPLNVNAMPETVKEWKRVPGSYKSENRTRGSDLGQQTDRWTFASPNRFLPLPLLTRHSPDGTN